MNSHFQKYLKVLESGDEVAKEKTLLELQRSFATLSQEQQKIAEIFLRDIHRGDVKIDASRSFRDYLVEYQVRAQNKNVMDLVQALGVDVGKLNAVMAANATEANLNEYGRFDDLKATIDKQKAKAYLESTTGEKLSPARVNIKAASLLRDFVLRGGFRLGSINDEGIETDEANSEHDNRSLPFSNLQEHQLVQLRVAMPEQGLLQGQSGTIVHLYADRLACEVEFISSGGSKVVTLQLGQIEPI
jgi:hypothetical protein